MQRYEIYLNWQKILPPVQQSPNHLRHNVKMWQKSEKLLPHLSHHRNHSVETPLPGSGSLHSHRQQHTPHVAHTPATEGRRKTLLQSAEDFRRRKLYTLLPFQRQTETTEKDILFRSMFVEDTVMFLYLTFFFRRKPITFTTKKFRLLLAIE